MQGPPVTSGDSSPGGDVAVSGYAWRVFALLLAINLFNFIDRYTLAAVLTPVGDELLADDPIRQQKMGWLVAAFLISYMVFSPIFGAIAGRFRRWTLIGGAVIFWSLAAGASGLATDYWFLLATRILMGIGEAAYGPVAPALLADVFPEKRRGMVMAWFYCAIPVGSALGYQLGGAMAGWFTWHWAFFTVVPPGIVLGLIALRMPDPQVRSLGTTSPGATPLTPNVPPAPMSPDVASRGWRGLLADYRALWGNHAFFMCTAGMTAITYTIGGMAAWMPSYILEYRRYGSIEGVNFVFGCVMVVSGLAATLLGGWAGEWAQRRHRGGYFIVCGVSAVVGFPLLLAALFTPFPLAWVLIFGAIFCLFFNTGPANTILANAVPSALRPTAFAVNIFVIHALGDAISPPLIGAIADKSNLNVGMAITSVMVLVGGVVWVWGGLTRRRGQDTDAHTLSRRITNPTVDKT